ncbi:hypothetical protein SARC_10075 [Sphaeroforma arctica JP610]|uniref:Major facilitator superfamily (MFS) profile domain-containing protein n=1 Tax=Sphaeroforma arctica JP610 TaxID=667725 RepID=A0A0L0FL00_9EUKA|nr:hypothetical protein SARC_10075 [Sphaeroforma arctica JP610]KNC77464.1 hypothetical protein SARC_10075 [Sphaeroforma arctica JP610]|eukprot:XP_014151366.1 hypothetical protein SARC_10075 [Sphaeroforma arctica JP610]
MEKKDELESTTHLGGSQTDVADQGYSAARDAKPNNLTYIAVFVAMLGAMMFGLDQGNFGNVQSFSDFQEYWCLGHDYGDQNTCGLGTEETCAGTAATEPVCISAGITDDMACCSQLVADNSHWHNDFVLWGATLITLGAAAGGLLVGPFLTNGFGRRLCICVGAVVTCVGCVFSSLLSFNTVPVFFAARFLTGFGVGVCCFALPMYNSEIATPGIRGMTGSMFQMNVVLGSFIATIVTLFIKNWHLGLMLPAVPGVIIAVTIWFTPESPRYVMSKKGYDDGAAILTKIRGGDITAEAQEIYEQLKAEEEAGSVSYGDLFSEANLRKRMLIGVFLQIAQQLTGVNAFLGYASTIFSAIGMTDPFLFNMIWNAVMVFGCAVGLAMLDSKIGGRRRQLLWATFIMGPPLILGGISLQLSWNGYITMVMVCIYGFGFQLAWGMIPWIYPSEIFSMREKDKAMSFAVFWQYLFNAVIVFITPHMMGWSTPGTFYVFGGLNCVNLAFVVFFIKETKGVPLEEIPALFGATVGGRSYA